MDYIGYGLFLGRVNVSYSLVYCLGNSCVLLIFLWPYLNFEILYEIYGFKF
jgi:hypothetical protein